MAQNLARLVIKRGYKPFVVIRHQNEASKSLYKKLGFVKEFEMARIVWTPFEYKDEVETDEDVKENGKKTNGNHVNGKDKANGVNSHET